MIDIIEEARDLWTEITGIDPNARSIKLGNWEIYKANEKINHALTAFADGGITGLLLMDAFVEDYLNDRSLSINSILRDYEGSMNYIKKCHKLYEVLRCPEMEEVRQGFMEGILSALKSYNYLDDDTEAVLADRHFIAFIRYSAMNSADKLRPFQFTKGEADNDRPKYLDTINEWWNVNSLIRGLAAMPKSGITLNLINDPNGFFSYFAFGMRNGQTITLFTDKPDYDHPLQKYMSRRPDREFDKRYAANYFPYDLMEFSRNQKGDPVMKQSWEERRLTLYQEKAHPIGRIGNIRPEEKVWTILMFDLIVEKFWRQNLLLPELSYTGDMVKVNTLLLDAPECKALALTDYKPINAPEIHTQELTADLMQEQCASYGRTGQHDWMEKRYGDKAGTQVLNLIEDESKTLYITSGCQDVCVATQKEQQHIQTWKTWPSGIKEKRVILHALDPCEFGTEEQLHKDRVWIARYNKAKVIDMLAQEEFDAEIENVKSWYKEKVSGNLQNLMGAIAKGEFIASDFIYKSFDHIPGKMKNIYRIYDMLDKDDKDDMRWHGLSQDFVRFTPGWERGRGWSCYITGGKSQYIAIFRPKTAEALAAVCNCSVKDLPVFLQNWATEDRYCGNSILDRIDPVEWAITNPWRKGFKPNIVFHLSKRGLKRIMSGKYDPVQKDDFE